MTYGHSSEVARDHLNMGHITSGENIEIAFVALCYLNTSVTGIRCNMYVSADSFCSSPVVNFLYKFTCVMYVNCISSLCESFGLQLDYLPEILSIYIMQHSDGCQETLQPPPLISQYLQRFVFLVQSIDRLEAIHCT